MKLHDGDEVVIVRLEGAKAGHGYQSIELDATDWCELGVMAERARDSEIGRAQLIDWIQKWELGFR